MHFFTIFAIALGLAMDAFAVSISAGLTVARVTPRHIFRVAFHFGLFQFMMPIIGWSVGRYFASVVSEYDHWIAFVLLALVGGKMIRDAVRRDKYTDENGQKSTNDPTRGWSLVALSIATSIDALAVGVSMALLQVNIWWASVIIGLVAATLSAAGILLGRYCSATAGNRTRHLTDYAGGLILIFIGLKILFTG